MDGSLVAARGQWMDASSGNGGKGINILSVPGTYSVHSPLSLGSVMGVYSWNGT